MERRHLTRNGQLDRWRIHTRFIALLIGEVYSPTLMQGHLCDETYVVTAALMVAFATSALAGSGAYYVGLKLGGRSCTIMTHAPNPKNDGQVWDEG